ncbi:retinol dehydrogenase 14-like isoform X2 [Physella acuta]|nr:retinol dehydrogenase 14-like isoform X2 [Physella acuta]XP_059152985.1 retinol dehydrogenase 14-like isoform X2 [Physella acuta]
MALLDIGQVFGIICVILVIAISAWLYFRKNVPMCVSKTDLTGKTALVTGANNGIGYFTALDFAKRNARVVLGCRNLNKGEQARDSIISSSGNKNVVVYEVDLCSLKSIRNFTKKFLTEEPRLDILVNNAGVVTEGKPKTVTDEGLETIFAVNYFGPFLLTNLLLDLMKKSAPSRIVNLSSVVNKYGTIDFNNLNAEKSFKHYERYFDSKLAIIMFTRVLARKLEGSGVTVNVLHPGSVATKLLDNLNFFIRVPVATFIRVFCKTGEEGAQTSIYLSVSDDVKDISGKYFVDCKIEENDVNPMSRNMEIADKLWTVTEELTGLKSKLQ